MKEYIVRYSYNHDAIESEMTISAESAEQAKKKALEYMIGRVISVKEKKPADKEKAIKESTINYALDVLRVQRGYIQIDKSGKAIDSAENLRQLSYYRGLLEMLEIVLTNGYENPGAIICSPVNNKHCFRENDDSIETIKSCHIKEA